ncbi:proline racemase family protein [Pseudarthrobacter sp. R1]|uniref:proline racemase family protein n=1 Tax=Pseudarthrobacter sp. R1 TaxID=2944934 RepID=UPI00210B145C|nr:proline racemase family protein [Pseudarthrobacter sp. R1]MCQ6272754.1 proline racemase family protein [Pseudarthrobacter sp. R1]
MGAFTENKTFPDLDETHMVTLDVLDAHAGGNPTRVLTGGFPKLAAKSVAHAQAEFRERFDYIRTALVLEPRGGALTSAAVLVEPGDERADIGLFFMEAHGYLDMCGSDTIAAVTALLESGAISMAEPLTHLVIETPAGLVEAAASVGGGRVKSVTFTNIPAHCIALDQEIDLSDGHQVAFDIAWGGNYFALVDATNLGMSVKRDIHALKSMGIALLSKLEKSSAASFRRVDHVLFYNEPPEPGGAWPIVVIVAPGTVDRSPCGTGTTARIASLVARGVMRSGESLTHEGPLGESFTGLVDRVEQLSTNLQVTVKITGRGYVIGSGKVHIYGDDPLRAGFSIPELPL